MTRRCSHCSHNGHNSRTCPNRGVKLFGVRLTDGSIRKSASMGNLSHYAGSPSGGGGGGGASPAEGGDHGGDAGEGYASEDFAQASGSSSRERKRGAGQFLLFAEAIWVIFLVLPVPKVFSVKPRLQPDA